MLFDKDEDGILAFGELEVVMRCLGQRPSGDFIELFSGAKATLESLMSVCLSYSKTPVTSDIRFI